MTTDIKEDGKVIAKVGTPDEAMWTIVKNNAQKMIDDAKKQIKVNTEFVKLAEQMIEKTK